MNAAIVQNFPPLLWRGAGGEVKIFDYIYAILHSPSYRERYKEYLKIDFPRIPYPQDAEQFNKLAVLGEKLRHLHLMETFPNPSKGGESPLSNWRGLGGEVANFPKSGSNKIEKPEYSAGKVWINDSQYFDNVPEIAWNFYIGGYQPAQKWLKDRRGRTLFYEDIEHYQKIIFVLNETDKVMRKVDEAIG
jgi:predicted helicase